MNIIFYAEYHEPTTFQTPFAGLWWAVVTMTTVGYGDVVPKSTLGKIIGSACAIEGLLMLAMPLAIIATKFNAHYQKMKDIQKFNQADPIIFPSVDLGTTSPYPTVVMVTTAHHNPANGV
jgi:hypothetical protein